MFKTLIFQTNFSYLEELLDHCSKPETSSRAGERDRERSSETVDGRWRCTQQQRDQARRERDERSSRAAFGERDARSSSEIRRGEREMRAAAAGQHLGREMHAATARSEEERERCA